MFAVITDTHYYNADALGIRTDHHQQTVNESGALLDAALDLFLARTDCDTLLIGGDVTCNGERESHDAFVEKLQRVQAAGKRVLLITSTHDFEQESNARRAARGMKVPGDAQTVSGVWNPGMTTRADLPALYAPFSTDHALAQFDAYSYVARLTDGLRILMLNDDGDGVLTPEGHMLCGYSDELQAWILAQIDAAQAAGESIIAMTHHPVLPPFPLYPLISQRDMLRDYETMRDFFADAGVHVVFTGHTHIHNIGHYTSPRGNTLTDINTAALCGAPAPIRFCNFADGTLDVRTETVKDFAWDLGGKSAGEYLNDHFDHLIRTIQYGAAHDFSAFVSACGDMGLPREKVGGHKLLVTLAGRFLEKATLGTLGTLLLCRHKLPKAAKRVPLGDLIVDSVRGIYTGQENYSPQTPVGAAVQVLAARLQKLVGKKLRGTVAEDLPAFFSSLLYDDTPDWDVQLTIDNGQ
ncbi:MAG: metallophosphoesterase [Oscillospiraceae bacterium]|jgi:3',5'-cyclic AMP phosphodiesterase CpdA|nr:metallophosphoesterase [Oscillospiraceae bacterium]